MIVRVELAQATMHYDVADLAEAQTLIRALTDRQWWCRFARFAYDGGKRYGCIRREDVLRAGILMDEDEAQREQ